MGINTQLKGIENQLLILQVIGLQGWAREYELSILTGLSQFMVEHTTKRLAELGQIHRKKIRHGAGMFCTLRTAGSRRIGIKHKKDVKFPDSWPHDCMAIQTLFAMKSKFDDHASIQTEAMLRKHDHAVGKIVDGKLLGVIEDFHLEQEKYSKKGTPLHSQSKAIVARAVSGECTVIAYPYPKHNTSERHDHERYQLNSLSMAILSRIIPANQLERTLENIWLCRINFDSLLDYENVLPSHFEFFKLLDLLPELSIQAKNVGMRYKFEDRPLREFGGFGPVIGNVLITRFNEHKVICNVTELNGKLISECTYNHAISIPTDLSDCLPRNWPATRAILEKQISRWLDQRIQIAS